MTQTHEPVEPRTPLKFWRLILSVLVILFIISASAQWYARNITLPRHCEDPDETLLLARRLLSERTPAGEGSRIPYIRAARLTFLIPRAGDEALDDYLHRLRSHLERQCQ